MNNQTSIEMTAPPEVYRQRRARLATQLQRPFVIFAGHALARNYATNPHRFRPGSTYLYFGGPPLEHAALLIEPTSDGDNGVTLLRPPAGPDDALWNGILPCDADLTAAGGLRQNGIGDPAQLARLLGGRSSGAIAPPAPDTLAQIAALGLPVATDEEIRAIVDLRNVKDEYELAAMRVAAEVSIRAHRAAMAAAKPGRIEADVAAAFMKVIHANQCDVSFNPIITVRGEVLHGHGHANPLTEGAILLCDAGAEEPGGYACDITRASPVSGKLTPIQRHIYRTVLKALNTATAACRPGRRYREIHDLSARVIIEGLVEAELLQGDTDELFSRAAHTLFYPHGVGHLIGLDVHDMEDFGDLAGYAPGRQRRPEFGNKL